MSHEMAISIMNLSKGSEVGLRKSFESAQFGQGVPETAFSGSVIVQYTKEVNRVTGLRAGSPVAENPGAGSGGSDLREARASLQLAATPCNRFPNCF